MTAAKHFAPKRFGCANAMALNAPGRMHIGWVEEARGVLSLYVVLHHAVLNIDQQARHDSLWKVLDAVFGWGHVSVDAFLVLSAFCLVLPLGTQGRFADFGHFLRRRAARLLPPYYAACALSLLLIALLVGAKSHTHWDVSVPVTPGGVLTHALLVHSWWPQFAAQIDHPLWSIGVEAQLCLLLPVLVWSCWRIGPWLTMTLATGSSYLAWRLTVPLGFPDPSPWGASIYYIGIFSMGVAAANLWAVPPARWAPRPKERQAAGVATAIMTSWMTWQVIHGHYVALQLLSFFVGAAVTAGILGLRWRPPARLLWPGPVRRTLGFVGQRSYSLYLIHAPLLQVVWVLCVRPLHLNSGGMQAVVMIVLGTLTSWLATLLFFQWVERPALNWSRRLPSRGRVPLQVTS